jgi:hypothetical protein
MRERNLRINERVRTSRSRLTSKLRYEAKTTLKNEEGKRADLFV